MPPGFNCQRASLQWLDPNFKESECHHSQLNVTGGSETILKRGKGTPVRQLLKVYIQTLLRMSQSQFDRHLGVANIGIFKDKSSNEHNQACVLCTNSEKPVAVK